MHTIKKITGQNHYKFHYKMDEPQLLNYFYSLYFILLETYKAELDMTDKKE